MPAVCLSSLQSKGVSTAHPWTTGCLFEEDSEKLSQAFSKISVGFPPVSDQEIKAICIIL
jgi:hypothetical protein